MNIPHHHKQLLDGLAFLNPNCVANNVDPSSTDWATARCYLEHLAFLCDEIFEGVYADMKPVARQKLVATTLGSPIRNALAELFADMADCEWKAHEEEMAYEAGFAQRQRVIAEAE